MAERIQMVGDPARPARMVEDPERIDEPTLAFFLDYWRDKRRDAVLPLRGSIAPRELGARLPWVTLCDALPELADFRYRVMGSRVCQYYLGNHTGKTVRETFAHVDPSIGEFVLRLLRRTCVNRAPIRLSGPASIHNKTFCPAYDSLYLPLSSNGEEADRVLGAFVFDAASLAGPRDAVLRPPVR